MSDNDSPHSDGARVYVKPDKPLAEMTRAEVDEFAAWLFDRMAQNMRAREKAEKAAARQAKAAQKKASQQ